MIISPKADEIVEVFKALGFEKTHNPTIESDFGETVSTTRLKDQSGFHVDVADVKSIPSDMTYIRMNVDDFEEAYKIFTDHGFKNTRGDGSLDTTTAKEATMVSPSGFRVALIKHIKKEDR